MMQKASLLATVVLLGLAAPAQEFPGVEVAALYSYARYAPSAAYTKGHSLNGGGGQLTINFTESIGIKMDLIGYGSTRLSSPSDQARRFFRPAVPSRPTGTCSPTWLDRRSRAGQKKPSHIFTSYSAGAL